ncbi:MAG: hypothetical protein ACOH5I_04835 [Oligoflexus sp.]
MSETDLVRLLLVKLDAHTEWFLGFLAILLLMGLSWVRQYFRRKHFKKNGQVQPDETDSVRQLFLELDCYLEGQDHEPRKVFLRSLTPNKATMLTTDTALQKGTALRVDLSPIFDSHDADTSQLVTARVARCTSVGGSPESFLINVHFTSSRSWAPTAIQKHMNESLHRLQGKTQQLEVL